MFAHLGSGLLVVPLVGIISNVAIAKAFGKFVDNVLLIKLLLEYSVTNRRNWMSKKTTKDEIGGDGQQHFHCELDFLAIAKKGFETEDLPKLSAECGYYGKLSPLVLQMIYYPLMCLNLLTILIRQKNVFVNSCLFSLLEYSYTLYKHGLRFNWNQFYAQMTLRYLRFTAIIGRTIAIHWNDFQR